MIFVELCAGSAAVMRYLTGEWKLLGYAGGKDGYAHRIVQLLEADLDPIDGIVLAEPGLWFPFWQAAAQTKLAEVASIVRELRDSDSDPRRLWADLRVMEIYEGTYQPSVEYQAARALVILAGTHGGHEIGGFKGKHKHRPNVDGFIPGLTSLAARIKLASLRSLPPIRVYRYASEVVPIPGAVCYIDPPYEGTTGYVHDLDRYQVLRLANRWTRAHARVAISERVSLVDELNGGKWKAVNISNDQHGQGRRSSTDEWVTLSTEIKR